MAEAQYLRLNTGVADPVLFSINPQTSLFWPVPWTVSTNVVKVQNDIPFQSNAAPGQEVTCEIDKVSTYVSMFHLRWRTSAVAIGGAATYARFCDFAGIFQVREIRVMYESNPLKVILPEEYMYHYYKELTIEKQQAFEREVGGGLTDAQRSARALGIQQWTLPILLPNYYTLRNATPVINLSQKLRFVVTWAPEGDTIQTDDLTQITGIYTFSTQPTIRVTNINTTSSERAAIIQRAATRAGINYLQNDFMYLRRQNFAIGAGTPNPKTSRLSNIRGPVAVIGFMLRPTVYVQSATGNPDPMRLVPEDWASAFMGGTGLVTLVGGAAKPTGGAVLQWQVTSSNNRFTPLLEREWTTVTIHSRYWPSPPGVDLYCWPYSNAPCAYNASYSSINYAQANEPVGEITLAAAIAGSAYFEDWFGIIKNFIQNQGGALVRTFFA